MSYPTAAVLGTNIFVIGHADFDLNGYPVSSGTVVYEYVTATATWVTRKEGNSMLIDRFDTSAFLLGSAFKRLTRGSSAFAPVRLLVLAAASILVAACGGGGSSSGGNNSPPVAVAKVPDLVYLGTTVTFDGTASSDPDGQSLNFSWVMTGKPTGSSASLSNTTSAMPTLVPDIAGGYDVSLTVSDGKLSSSTSARVFVKLGVVADAGPDQKVFINSQATLDGSKSSDASGGALTYQWTLTTVPAGSKAALSNSTAVKPTFVPDVAGDYVASLTAGNGKVNSLPDTVTITASALPWSSGAPMPTARTNVVAVAAGTNIYVLGGLVANAPVGTVEVYDTVNNSWSTAPSMPTPRKNFSAIYNGNIYTIGGEDSASPANALSTVEVFDPTSGTWSTGVLMPLPRSRTAVSKFEYIIYVAGGYQTPAAGCHDWVCHAAADLQAFDTRAGTWKTLASMPQPLIGAGAIPQGIHVGSILVMGGERQDGIVTGGPAAEAYSFDITSNKWMASPSLSLPSRMSSPTVVALFENDILVMGHAFDNTGAPVSSGTVVYEYPRGVNSWIRKLAPSPETTGQNATLMLTKVYVFNANSTDIYDPQMDLPYHD